MPKLIPGIPEIFRREAQELERREAEQQDALLAQTRERLARDPCNSDALIFLVYLLRKRNNFEEALQALQERTEAPQCPLEVHYRHIELLVECNRTAAAMEAARSAGELFPDDVLLRMFETLILPVIYNRPGDIPEYRERYSKGLARLTSSIRLDCEARRDSALQAVSRYSNVYLGYQAQNDVALQCAYGKLVHRIVAAHDPAMVQNFAMPSPDDGMPLRIGYVSSRFRDVSATRFFLGWLRGHNRQRFSIHSWHLHPVADQATEEVRTLSDVFHQMDEPLREIAGSIRSYRLHALIFLDIGIEPRMTPLAAMRLAPIQCMAWDHPVTSGLPTIDYALTGDLSEPADGSGHYSEELVRLPGVGVCYRKPLIPWPLLTKRRSDFSLREDAIVYLCCQSAQKFLPQNDDVFVRIAAREPHAQFVFVVPNRLVGEDFRARLRVAFSAAGLDEQTHCILMPRLNHLDYWNLHLAGDIFLDTIGWSSGGSVFEAIACRLPVVTMPGETMRSRQGAAILEQLGVRDTIARDKNEFVEIALRLGRDKMGRQQLTERMERSSGQLYSDERSVAALEEFLLRAISLRSGC